MDAPWHAGRQRGGVLYWRKQGTTVTIRGTCVDSVLLCTFTVVIVEQASSSESSDKTERASSSQKSDDESEKEDKSGCQFTINPALVPAYIPFRVIEKVGSAVYYSCSTLYSDTMENFTIFYFPRRATCTSILYSQMKNSCIFIHGLHQQLNF